MTGQARAQVNRSGAGGRLWGREAAVRVAVIGGLLVVLFVVGRSVALNPMLGLGLGGLVLYVGLAVADTTLIPTLAMPMLAIGVRVGSGAVGLTVSDATLAVAALPAILYSFAGVSRHMRQALWLGAAYQVAALFTVLNNPYRANLVEWFHVALLVLGAMIIGWAVGSSGRARLGLNLLVLAIGVIALGTLASAARQYAGGNFEAVYPSLPYPMHKNAAGTIVALGALVLYVRPTWMGWSRKWSLTGFWIFVAATATTQSRQALIGLAVAISVLVLRRTKTRRRSKAILLAMVPAAVAISVMVRDQAQSGNEFNSLFQRLDWFQTAIGVWGTDPWFGVGMRWWYTDHFPVRFQPPNALIETLTSNGVVGLLAFILLLVGAWVVARRLDPVYGVLAELVMLQLFVKGQLDLFWVSIQVSVPFVVLGLCIGAAARHERLQRQSDELRADAGLDAAETSAPSGRAGPQGSLS